jgi:Ala-tRNA(Pro) deacylase
MTPTWINELLDRHGMHYENLHSPEGFTAQSLAADERGYRQSAAEVAIAVADGRLLELVVPAQSWVDLDRVREFVGCRNIQFATEAELRKQYPLCEPGTVPPLRRPVESDVIMDSWVDVNSNIVFLAGSPRDAIRIPIHEWIEMVNPRIGPISQLVEDLVSR